MVGHSEDEDEEFEDEDEEREERIQNEIIVDSYGPEEQALGWHAYLSGKLQFPFSARCVVRREISPLEPGDEVEVMVLGVDPEKKRISLSLKQAQQAKAAAAAPTPAPVGPEEEEAPAPAKTPRPRTTPLKGGIGSGAALFPDLPSRGQ